MTRSPPESVLEVIRKLYDGAEIVSIQSAKSAQQEVWILRLSPQPPKTAEKIIVVRIWKGGCQWWNLNRNHHVSRVADSETMGYRLARTSLEQAPENHVIIPQVLYHSNTSSSTTASNIDSNPWAILEYVGSESRYFDHDTNQLDNTYLHDMVKLRHEFGFEEPHPRWGRVPSDQALEYAMMILHQIIVPLHKQSSKLLMSDQHQNGFNTTPIRTYSGMVQLYQQAYQDMTESNNQHSAVDNRMATALSVLKTAVSDILPRNTSHINDNLPPVLVHLDLQPQNILFTRGGSPRNNHSNNSFKNIKVRAVLDWEDAAIADPRFELLLLGRKVCANREQAETIWHAYARMMMTDTATSDNSKSASIFGPLKPWLQLETVHSTTTLLLQSLDLLNGGRNPWETKSDLWAKLQKELERWKRLCAED